MAKSNATPVRFELTHEFHIGCIVSKRLFEKLRDQLLNHSDKVPYDPGRDEPKVYHDVKFVNFVQYIFAYRVRY